MKYEDIEIYSADRSAEGNNAYYVPGCEHVGHSPSYAACLSKIAKRQDGKLPAIFAQCDAAISTGLCKAIAMREQELKEGRAIYFVNRRKLNEFIAERTGTEVVELTKTAEPIATPVVKTPAEENGYAAAINSVMANLSGKPKQEIPSLPIQAGMSLAEIAALRNAASI